MANVERIRSESVILASLAETVSDCSDFPSSFVSDETYLGILVEHSRFRSEAE